MLGISPTRDIAPLVVPGEHPTIKNVWQLLLLYKEIYCNTACIISYGISLFGPAKPLDMGLGIHA